METVHEKWKPFECNQCGSKFDVRSTQIRHMKTVHEKVKLFKCSLCNSKFGHKYHLFGHIKAVHYKVKPFECNLCDSKFVIKSRLKRHMRIVHEKLKPINCSLCDYKFEYKSLQIRHMSAVHEKLKAFKCSLCDSKFGRKGAQDKHMRVVHEDLKPYKCDICHTKFAEKSNLKRHMKIRPYQCLVCCSHFVNDSGLNAHLKMNCSTKRKTETSMIKPEKTISDQVLNSSSKVLPSDKNIALPESQFEGDVEGKCSSKFKTETVMGFIMKYEEIISNKSASSSSQLDEDKKWKFTSKLKTETVKMNSQPEIERRMEQSSLYQCDICEGALNNARSLEEHFKQIHKSNLVFACSACKIRFPKEDMLTQHKEGCFERAKSSSAEGQIDKKITLPANDDNRSMKEEEDDIKEQLYECDICEIVMFDAKSLEAHYLHVHKSNLAFACNNCSKRYPKEDMLNQHIHVCIK